jgi:6-phosphofructokinase 1
MVDVLVGAIVKRMSYGKSDGVAILAEGLVEHLEQDDLQALVDVERDAHDNIRIAEINFGEILKYKVQEKLRQFNLKTTIVAKNIGYELRCADPIPFDMEYTRDLGFSAAQFMLNGGSGAMVSIQNGHFVPLYFKDILDPVTKKTKVRMVDPTSESFYIARRYMLRLSQADFEDPHELAKYAATCGISLEEFRNKFFYLIENDRMYKNLENGKFVLAAPETNKAFSTGGKDLNDQEELNGILPH